MRGRLVDLLGGNGRHGLGHLRLRSVVLPVAFVALAEVVRHLLFASTTESAWSIVFFFVVLGSGAVVFSYVTFAAIDRLTERTRRQNRQLGALTRIALLSASQAPLGEILDQTVAETLAAVRADAGLICLVDLERREHTAVAARGFSEQLTANFHRLPLDDDPIATEVVATGGTVAIECLLDDPRFAPIATREGIYSSISTPLRVHGSVAGVLALATHERRVFDEADREFLLNVAGQLALVVTHANAYETALRRARELEALVAVGAAAASSLELKGVLCRSIATMSEVAGVDAGEVWLADADELVLAGWPQQLPLVGGAEPRLRGDDGLAGLVRAHGAAVVIADTEAEQRPFARALADAGLRCCAGFPLVHRGQFGGVLVVASSAPEAFAERERIRLLEGVAEVMSVAVENARLHERVQEEAVLEERERLAHELHDGLAQVLAFVNAQSIAVRKWIGADRRDEALAELGRMQDAVRVLYGDVREAILGLRSSKSTDGGLIAAASRYVAEFERMSGIDVVLELAADGGSTGLDQAHEIQVMRILQEALSNVRRHSRAKHVRVAICLGDGALRLEVADDGRGFDPEAVLARGWPRFGLSTMRERAESVGGSFAIASEPGAGTSVTASVPRVDPGGGDAGVLALAGERAGARAPGGPA